MNSPTGHWFRNRGLTVADFRGDRICAFFSTAKSFIEQLGLLPTEETDPTLTVQLGPSNTGWVDDKI